MTTIAPVPPTPREAAPAPSAHISELAADVQQRAQTARDALQPWFRAHAQDDPSTNVQDAAHEGLGQVGAAFDSLRLVAKHLTAGQWEGAWRPPSYLDAASSSLRDAALAARYVQRATVDRGAPAPWDPGTHDPNPYERSAAQASLLAESATRLAKASGRFEALGGETSRDGFVPRVVSQADVDWLSSRTLADVEVALDRLDRARPVFERAWDTKQPQEF